MPPGPMSPGPVPPGPVPRGFIGVGLATTLPAGRDLLAPSRIRRAPSSGQLARRRVLVRVIKWLLPALAVGLLALIVLWPELERGEERSRVAFRRTVQPRTEALRVIAPRYQGVDALGRAYTVTADAAEQPGAAPVLDLVEPRADIALADGGWVFVQAARGHYDRPDSRLDLAGEVTLFHDNGSTLVTPAAVVRLDAGSASGDAPVAAQGPFGTLVAEGFRLTERGAVVVFTGRARTVLEGSK